VKRKGAVKRIRQGGSGQEFKSLTKWSDIMPINVTFTNSRKTSLQNTKIKILIFTFAASRLNSKV